MSLLRTVRAEWSGALRSVRHDVNGRPVEPPERGPDVTSTGMNTFGGLLSAEEPAPRPAARRPKARRPRRAALITGLGVLSVVGAAGAYLGVVNGLGSILNGARAEAGTVPAQAGDAANSGIGRGPARPKSPAGRNVPMPTTTPIPAGSAAPPADAATTPGAAATATTGATPTATAVRNATPTWTTGPAAGECFTFLDLSSRFRVLGACSAPPVPTPTAPRSVPTPGDSANPGDDSDGMWPGETFATRRDSADPRDYPHAWHRRRHH